jgi:hypothetical protein
VASSTGIVFGDPRDAKWCMPGEHAEGVDPADFKRPKAEAAVNSTEEILN